MGGRTGGLVGGLAVVVGVCHYTIASSKLVTTIVKLNFFIIKCQFQALMFLYHNVAKTDTSIKLNYWKKVFFTHPFICQRHFINEKVGNRRNYDHLVFSFEI